jgi:hypothetical protein
MISDKERRRIANELREAASAKGKRSGSMELMLSKLLGIAKQDRGVFGQPVDVAATWRDVYRSLANLIDRPTCRNIYAETEKVGGCENGFKCSECGNTVEDYEGYRISGEFNFCSKCGRDVVE